LKRFYDAVAITENGDGFGVTLDGKPVMTPAKQQLTLPHRAFAEAVAAEWRAQEAEIDPARMQLTRLANTALDRVAPRREEVIAEISAFGATDLVCYRAASPPVLVAAQLDAWQPLIEWAAARYGAALNVTTGIQSLDQPPEVLEGIRGDIAGFDDFALAALHAATAACRSVVIALALAEARLDTETAWAVAVVDDTYQADKWGDDPDETLRLQGIRQEIAAAGKVLALCSGDIEEPLP
jgi:chaperone required for assembly of F1-ATPase